MKGSTAPKVFLTFAIVFILFAAVTALISILGKPTPALLSINKIDYAVSPTIKVFAEGEHLIASTSAGTRVLTVSTDKAVNELIKNQAASKVNAIMLVEIDGIPAYEISALKSHRLVGIIPITLPIKINFSPETGEILRREQSRLANIIDLISF